MKITFALSALAAVAFAPFAAAQITCGTAGNAQILGNLTSTSTIKRVRMQPKQSPHHTSWHPTHNSRIHALPPPCAQTTVTGGHRIVQSVTIKNNAATTANGLQFFSNYDADQTFLKGTAKIFGSSKPVITANATQVTSSVFALPAGKTLKATLVYKAKNCPTLVQPRPLGNLVVTIPADSLTSTTCRTTNAATNVR